jgi:hypothetical protein
MTNRDLPEELFHPNNDLMEFIEASRKRSYSVVERTEPCGKDACACTDNPDAEHGPYRYHIYTRDDGTQRWEYQGPCYDL